MESMQKKNKKNSKDSLDGQRSLYQGDVDGVKS